jgi:hypothetical protein
MTSDRKQKPSNSIPISFFDGDDSRPDTEDDSMSDVVLTPRARTIRTAPRGNAESMTLPWEGLNSRS